MGMDDRALMMGTRYRPVVVIASVLLMAYVAARSQLLSFTYDEVGALAVAKSFTWGRISENAGIHLLNALFTSWVHLAGFDSEPALRLPNTLSFAVYLIAAIDLGRGLKRPLALLQFVLLTLNPFLLDFFSLARGYGLGLAALLAGIAFAIRYLRADRILWCVAAVLSGMFSVLANYTMMNFFVPLVLMLLLIAWHNGRQGDVRAMLIRGSVPVGLSLAFFTALLPVLLGLREGGHFYFGGRWDLYSDTIASLGRCFGYHSPHGTAASIAFQLVFVLAIAWALWRAYHAVRTRTLAPTSVVAVLLVLSLLSALSQFYLMGTPYPVERTALLYCPLMALCAAHALSERPWRWARIPALLAGGTFMIHFASTMNFSHCYSWRYDSGSRAAVNYLRDTHKGDIRFGIMYEHSPSIWHYRKEDGFAELIITEVTGCWEYCPGLEELNPRYYGGSACAKPFDPTSMHTLLSHDIDVYYLDRFYTDEMDRLGVQYKVLQSFPYSRTKLITEVHY